MKVLIAYARNHFPRVKFRRKRKAIEKEQIQELINEVTRNDIQATRQNMADATPPAAYSEKEIYELPPSYHECVLQPPIHPPEKREPRGRPREILYRSQLNELVERRKIRRPLPPAANRRPKRILQEKIDYGALLRTQADAAAWMGHFRVLEGVLFLFLMVILVGKVGEICVRQVRWI